jgi:hypothetical protein
LATRTLLLLALLLVQTPAAQPAPFTEIEALKVQNLNLERIIVQRALDDWRAKQAALKAEIEKVRPGWDWNPETGAWSAKEKK